MRLKPWIIVVITMISFVISGCTKNDASIIEKIQKEFPSDFQNEAILHAETMGNGLLVFFRSNKGLGTGFFKQQTDHWEWVTGSGYASLNPDNGLSVHHSNREEISSYLSYGIITNPDIFEIKSSEKKAKMIQIPDGTRIWFISYENPLGKDGSLPPISGITKNGIEIITIQ